MELKPGEYGVAEVISREIGIASIRKNVPFNKNPSPWYQVGDQYEVKCLDDGNFSAICPHGVRNKGSIKGVGHDVIMAEDCRVLTGGLDVYNATAGRAS
jgi:hypothetical protein